MKRLEGQCYLSAYHFQVRGHLIVQNFLQTITSVTQIFKSILHILLYVLPMSIKERNLCCIFKKIFYLLADVKGRSTVSLTLVCPPKLSYSLSTRALSKSSLCKQEKIISKVASLTSTTTNHAISRKWYRKR